MQSLEIMFSEVEIYNKLFRAKTYVDSVEKFYGKYGSIFEKMNSDVENEAEKLAEILVESEKVSKPVQDIIDSVAKEFVDKSKTILVINGKHPNGRRMMEVNIYMVMYVFPGIIAVKGRYSVNIAETIATMWNGTFKNTNLSCSDYDNINSGFRRKLCYITTAVCASLGKPDDCTELNLLRNFRDGYMMSTESGRRMVEEYYNSAPAMVSAIDTRCDADDIYKKLYDQYIDPCITMINSGQMENCMKHYKSMVERLG